MIRSWSGKEQKGARSVGRHESEVSPSRQGQPGNLPQSKSKRQSLSLSFSVFSCHLFLVCVPLAALSSSLSLSLVIPFALGSRRKVFQGDETRPGQLREEGGGDDRQRPGRIATEKFVKAVLEDER